MDADFEEHLKASRVNKRTIKALRAESIRNAATLDLMTDSDIAELCAQHKLSTGMSALLRSIRDEGKHLFKTQAEVTQCR